MFSGFWLEKDFFMSCGHILGSSIPSIYHASIIGKLKMRSPAIAVVSSELDSAEIGENRIQATLLTRS